MAMKIAHLAQGNIPEQMDAAGDHPNPQSAGGGSVPQGTGQTYPHGAAMTLTHDELEKMGHKKPPKHGAEVHFEGHGHVKEITTHTGSDGQPQHRVHIQMTHLGMEHDGQPKKSAGEKVYGGKETVAEEKKEAKSGAKY